MSLLFLLTLWRVGQPRQGSFVLRFGWIEIKKENWLGNFKIFNQLLAPCWVLRPPPAIDDYVKVLPFSRIGIKHEHWLKIARSLCTRNELRSKRWLLWFCAHECFFVVSPMCDVSVTSVIFIACRVCAVSNEENVSSCTFIFLTRPFHQEKRHCRYRKEEI